MKAFFIALICLAWGGCASTSSNRPSDIALRTVGAKKFGNDHFVVAIIPGTAGPGAEATVAGLSAVFGPGSLVRYVASNLQNAHSQQLDMMFYGNTRAKTEKVIKDSLGILPAGSLLGMRMYAPGIDPISIQDAVHRAGAQLVK